MLNAKGTPGKQFKVLVWTGLSIIILFAVGFFWLTRYVMMHGGVGIFTAVAPIYMFLYLIVISFYVAFFAITSARGRWNHSWLWGIGGFALTALFTIVLPIILTRVFRYVSPVLFAFIAPVLSTTLIMTLIFRRKKVSL
jgi:hypothetical protein